MTAAFDEADELVSRWRNGDVAARDRLFRLLAGDLAKRASLYLRKERAVTLHTGDLVNEAVVRLCAHDRLSVNDRNHLLNLAAQVMRRHLVTLARSRRRQKRDGQAVTLSAARDVGVAADVDVLDLEVALRRLSELDPRRAEIVEMRFFGGLTIEQIADVLRLSPATVKRGWEGARVWLQGELIGAQ